MARLNSVDRGRPVDSVMTGLLRIASGCGGVDPSRRDIRAMVAADDVEALKGLLKDEDWRERVRAVRGLGLVGDARVIEPLVRGLMDEEEQVRQEAALALDAIEKKMERMYLAR